ncbi:MAG: L-seryl-tRNA(Sec) selenium transferase [Planctomycetota bacterium]|nr:L-seryl-tRNA(Sec) selenium transferase [Planctomycetota bacterium]
MTTPDSRRLRAIPSVGEILSQAACVELIDRLGREPTARFAREAVDALRNLILAGDLDEQISRPEFLEIVLRDIDDRVTRHESCRLGPVINATGVILHTSLGRASLSERATAALVANSRGCNLEVAIDSGERSQRGDQLLSAFRDLTGAGGALVVNNNAAATVLALSALAKGREVIISRGQLIEIGGSFRLPEIFAASGAVLREVGATNRTHVPDYARAITAATAGILRVHPSNYRIEGFAHSPEIGELVELARQNGIWAIDDIGSGCLVDTTRFGLPKEPTFADSLRAGADLVLGDRKSTRGLDRDAPSASARPGVSDRQTDSRRLAGDARLVPAWGRIRRDPDVTTALDPGQRTRRTGPSDSRVVGGCWESSDGQCRSRRQEPVADRCRPGSLAGRRGRASGRHTANGGHSHCG